MGHRSGLALTRDGTAWSWGWGYDGQLGDGSDDDQLVPRPIPDLDADVVALGAGLALKADGTVWAWGGEVPADERRADRAPIGATKLGGRPDLPPEAMWPAHESRPLLFMAQVRLADVARLDGSGLLPETGLLSFFFLHLYDPIGATASVVAYFPEGTPLVRTEFPEELADRDRNRPVAVTPEIKPTLLPHPPDFLEEAEHDPYVQMYYDGLEPGTGCSAMPISSRTPPARCGRAAPPARLDEQSRSQTGPACSTT